MLFALEKWDETKQSTNSLVIPSKNKDGQQLSCFAISKENNTTLEIVRWVFLALGKLKGT
jgi:hypothetical protein